MDLLQVHGEWILSRLATEITEFSEKKFSKSLCALWRRRKWPIRFVTLVLDIYKSNGCLEMHARLCYKI